jgi:hypothetical protein
VAFADQALDAMGQHRGLASAGARDHQHGSVDVLDGFALAIVRSERSGAETRLRRRHCEQDITWEAHRDGGGGFV